MSNRRTGERHPNAKLTQEQVDAIRASRMGGSELARLYKVSKATISLIKRGKLWVKSGDGAPPAPTVEQPAPPAPAGLQAPVPTPINSFPADTKRSAFSTDLGE